MRFPIVLSLAILPTIISCGAGPEPTPIEPSTAQNAPGEDAEGAAAGDITRGGMGDLNTTISVPPEIADAWTGVRILVIDNDSSDEQIFDVMLGETEALGDSGLTIEVETFVPDFAMDENGIRSRSAHTDNPAARVLITDEAGGDFRGWLFSAMPEIHPFEHSRYQVLLVEGIPVG